MIEHYYLDLVKVSALNEKSQSLVIDYYNRVIDYTISYQSPTTQHQGVISSMITTLIESGCLIDIRDKKISDILQ